MDPTDPPQSFQIPLSWVGFEETPIAYANNFLIQFQSEGAFVLGIGQATPPALVGTPQEVAAQMEDVTFVPVRTLARVALSPSKLRELIAALQANLDNWERIERNVDPRTQP
jgi:hypothetical protein